jgi:hypothetical protein
MAAFGASVAWPTAASATGSPALGQPVLSSESSGGTNPYAPFPYAGNTGVPAGTVLTPSGGFTVSAPNQTFIGLDISGTVTLNSGATNCTFRNCRFTITSPTATWAINNSAGASGLTVKNCTLIGAGANSTVVNYAIQPNGSVVMIDGCDFGFFGQPINIGVADQVTIQNCYIHDLNSNYSGTVHYECIYIGGTSTANPSLTIQNNTLINTWGWTAALFMKNNVAGLKNIIVRNNLLWGGGYSTYCNDGGTSGVAQSNCQYINNAMVKGQYGYLYPNDTPAVWSGNYDYYTNASIPGPSGSGKGAGPYAPFPYSGNTGVPAGTVLTPATSANISTPGTYSGFAFTGIFDITASNVTLQNCSVTSNNNSASWVIRIIGNLTNVVIKNCTIVGPGSAATPNEVDAIHCTDSSQFTVDGCDISQTRHSVLISGGTTTVQNCYFHDLYSVSGSHHAGIWVGATSSANPSHLIQNNTIILNQNQTGGAVFLQNMFGTITNVTVNANYLSGGTYTAYCDGSRGGGAITNVSFNNNAFVKGQYDYNGFVSCSPTWTGNYDYNTKAAI